jgi:D-alanyl-D-alanine carboxypeptidase/D-alanyl-D-alanine-endopeptidase (penicillin-binding protein 4)
MLKNKFYLVMLLCCLYIPAGAQPYTPQGRLGDKFGVNRVADFWQQLDDIFNDPNFSGAQWGVVIRSLETGEYLYKRNEDKLLMPASNIKLFTTSAALSLLGPHYKYKTNFYVNGSVDADILKGDLIVQGTGDPTFSGKFSNGDIWSGFNKIADTLLSLGIEEISGNIIGDDNYFDDKDLGEGWEWDYATNWYSAPSGALCFNDNCIAIEVKPGSLNKPAWIKADPDIRYATIINKIVTVDKEQNTEIEVVRMPGTNIITVYGKISEKSEPKYLFSTIKNPTQFTMVAFKQALEKKGIRIKGYAADIDDENFSADYSKLKCIYTNYSLPLGEIIKIINKESNNFYAEQLLKTIGWEIENYGSAENGVKAVKKFLQETGVSPENIVMVDGSGLSRLNLVSCKQLSNFLAYMYRSDMYGAFRESLPVAGVDGTLEKRMIKTRAVNNVRAKTGYIPGVRSMSGFVNTADGEPVVFSIIVNNFIVPSALADNIQDLVCLRLANFSRK